jgi:hypothetical protein
MRGLKSSFSEARQRSIQRTVFTSNQLKHLEFIFSYKSIFSFKTGNTFPSDTFITVIEMWDTSKHVYALVIFIRTSKFKQLHQNNTITKFKIDSIYRSFSLRET